jgi:hypothetical protein
MPVNQDTACDIFQEAGTADPASTAAAAGAGGGLMASWATDAAIVNNLLTGAYTNASSYPIPAVVYEGAAVDSFQEAATASPAVGAVVGGGG